MLNDAIRMIAAAVCCDQKRISIPVTPHQALGSVNLLLLQLAAHSEISEAGEAHITVIPRTPDVSAPRFGTLSRELFFLFAGLCAKLNLVLQVNAVEEGVSEDELDALSRALDGVLVYAIKKESRSRNRRTRGVCRRAAARSVHERTGHGIPFGTIHGYARRADGGTRDQRIRRQRGRNRRQPYRTHPAGPF